MYAHISRVPRDNEPGYWSSPYQSHPALLIGLAAGVGLVFGIMRARRASRSAQEGSSSLVPARPRPALRERSPKVSQLITSWQDISDALLGVAITRAVDAIAERVPGFKAQYERRSALHASSRLAGAYSSER